MASDTIKVEPISRMIGAEIHGIDISKPLGDENFNEIHNASMAYQVIFFRGQEINLEQHKQFGRNFGDLHIHPTANVVEGHPEIITIHSDENSRALAGMKWHSDVSCDVEPPMGSILHLHRIPEVGGDTIFASMYTAYKALSEPIKTLIRGLQAWHESAPVHRGRFGHKGQLRDGTHVYPEGLHPIVRTHPITKRKAIFVNEHFTTRIDGLKKSESDSILKMLFDHIAVPEFHCRFRWQEKSVAFWDNRCVQHRTGWDYYPKTRQGYRVTIAGDRPF